MSRFAKKVFCKKCPFFGQKQQKNASLRKKICFLNKKSKHFFEGQNKHFLERKEV